MNSEFSVTQSASGKGGAIYIEGDRADVFNSSFVRANSTAGGIIYIEGDDAHVVGSSMMKASLVMVVQFMWQVIM